jgi:hypothetical protein
MWRGVLRHTLNGYMLNGFSDLTSAYRLGKVLPRRTAYACACCPLRAIEPRFSLLFESIQGMRRERTQKRRRSSARAEPSA